MRYIDPIYHCSFFILIASILADHTGGVISCLRAKNVPFEVEKSENWTSLVTPSNRLLQYIPAVITAPLTPEQLGGAADCAIEYGFRVQAKVERDSFPSYVITQWKVARYSWFGLISLFGGADSQIEAAASFESVGSDREALMNPQNHVSTADNSPSCPPQIRAFLNYLTNSVATNESHDFSANSSHNDPDLSPSLTIRLKDGQPNSDRLVESKKQVDPKHVVRKPEAVEMGEEKPLVGFMDAAGRLGLVGGWLVLYLIICGIGLGSFFSDQRGSGCFV